MLTQKRALFDWTSVVNNPNLPDLSEDEEEEAPKPPKKRTKASLLAERVAEKRAAIAAEKALGPLPAIPQVAGRPFAPRLLPEGLFEDDRDGERWAAHPDFPPEDLLVSNYGFLRKRGRHAAEGVYETFTLGCLDPTGYRKVRIGKKVKQVHILGCAAFHGPKPPGNCTVDHIAKYDGDFMRERSDNRACNLRWATKAEQSMNQKAHCVHSNGVPILARPVGSTDDWRSYTSATAASKDLGIDTSSISKVCDATKTTKQTAGGWVFRIDYSKLESQENLPAEERGPPDARFTVRVERWQLDPESGGSTWVSTRGRVQTKNTNGDDFSPMRTPRPREGEVYAIVSGDKVHLVVWRTFCANNIPTGTDSIDHWDQTKANNCLYNLRRATRSEQAFNRTLPSADDQIRARACARMEGTTKFYPGGISQSVREGWKCNGWHFASATSAEDTAKAERDRVRVLAAIAALRAEEAW